MYDPAARPSPNLAFLWPAFAAAAAGDMASLVAKQLAEFAIGGADGQVGTRADMGDPAYCCP